MHEDMTFNAWRVQQRLKKLDQGPKEQQQAIFTQSRFTLFSTTSKKLKFFFSLILIKAWNLDHWGLRWPKALQWWQTMCLGPLGFLGRDLATWFCSFFNLWHWGLIWPITPQWWQVGTNLDPSKALGWDLNGGFDLTAFLSTFWFLLCGGMYTDLSFEVEHTISTKSDTTTWLQQIFSSILAISSVIKHLACILRDSFSQLRSSTSLLDN